MLRIILNLKTLLCYFGSEKQQNEHFTALMLMSSPVTKVIFTAGGKHFSNVASLMTQHPAHHCNLFLFRENCSYFCRYSLEWNTESDSCFDIETVEGTISTHDYLDREAAVQHNITVVATEVSKYPTPKASLKP